MSHFSNKRDRIGVVLLGLIVVSFVLSFVYVWVPLPWWVVLSLAAGMCGLSIVRMWIAYRDRGDRGGESFSTAGVSVEVDCRACGQFNRVPSHRLRDRPKCGRCKARLMPGRRIVLCRVRDMDRALRAELDALWRDEDRLWQSLADHVAIQGKADAEARGDQPRVVN